MSICIYVDAYYYIYGGSHIGISTVTQNMDRIRFYDLIPDS